MLQKQLEKYATDYKDFGQTVSNNCGGHIHIGANYLTMEESWNNLGDIWGNAEKILYIISNEAGELPRHKVNQTARPFSKVLEEKLNDEREEVENKKSSKKIMINAQNERYYGINFKKSDTIEFRLSNGTLNANTWIENINLFGDAREAPTADDILPSIPNPPVLE